MENEAVAFVLIIAIFVFSLWLACGIQSLSQKLDRIEAILNILKNRQEAVEPTINEDGEAYCICGENVGIIPNNKNLPSVRTKYCSECGRRMKWKYD